MTTQPETDALLSTHTARLLETAAGLDDVGAASLCEGWTRGHVLTHVSRNADAIGRLASWAVTGRRQDMYPGGQDSRDAEIEAGSSRELPEQVADLTSSAQALVAALAALTGPLEARTVEMRGGMEVPADRLPFLRLREVVYHHVDLDAGFTFEDVEPDLARAFISDAVHRLGLGTHPPAVTLNATEGDSWTVGDGTAQVTGSLGGLLLWLARRIETGVHAEAGPLPTLPRGA